MSRSRTYYDVLGVSRNATTDQLRRAHRNLVRRYHPDTATQKGHIGPDEAAQRIREVNEAWAELRDPEHRARYDRRIAPEPPRTPYTPFPPDVEPEPDGGFDEWFADADYRRNEARVVTRRAEPAKPFRVRILFGFGVIVLVGILLVVFITGESTDGSGPAVGRGACVQVNPNGPPTQVPCDLPNDGQVITQVRVPGECPNGSMARQLSANDTRVTCLAPRRR